MRFVGEPEVTKFFTREKFIQVGVAAAVWT